MINFVLVCHGPDGAGEEGGSLNRGHPYRPWGFFLLPHYRLCAVAKNSEDFSVL
jgi:hypothetical protein